MNYANLDILVFLIQDYHFENVVFLKENLDSKLQRFKSSYGVMSKLGFWVGLKRNDYHVINGFISILFTIYMSWMRKLKRLEAIN